MSEKKAPPQKSCFVRVEKTQWCETTSAAHVCKKAAKNNEVNHSAPPPLHLLPPMSVIRRRGSRDLAHRTPTIGNSVGFITIATSAMRPDEAELRMKSTLLSSVAPACEHMQPRWDNNFKNQEEKEGENKRRCNSRVGSAIKSRTGGKLISALGDMKM